MIPGTAALAQFIEPLIPGRFLAVFATLSKLSAVVKMALKNFYLYIKS